MHGFDRFPSRWKFINHRYVQVSVKGHCQGPGDGSSSHDQHMGWLDILFPQPGPLGNPKAVLLVNDYQSQVLKLYRFLEQCMGPGQDLHAPIEQ